MGWDQVIAIQAVFAQQLPVRLDVVPVGSRDDAHSSLGLVYDQIQVFPGPRQIGDQVLDVGVEADEIEPPITVDSRRFLEAEFAPVEIWAVGFLVRDADQLPFGV